MTYTARLRLLHLVGRMLRIHFKVNGQPFGVAAPPVHSAGPQEATERKNASGSTGPRNKRAPPGDSAPDHDGAGEPMVRGGAWSQTMTVDEAATIATNILKRELRLIATDELCEDCGDPISWRVKPGNIEHCAMLIAQAIIDGEVSAGGKE